MLILVGYRRFTDSDKVVLGRKNLVVLTMQGEATYRFQTHDYAAALPLFLKLSTLKRETEDIHGAIIALSDAGVMELCLKHYDAARNYTKQAISLAKSTDTRHWLVPSIGNYLKILQAQGKRYEPVRFLKRELRYAERAEEWGLVADLAALLAQLLLSLEAPAEAIDRAWMRAIAAADKQGNIFKQVELLRQRYAWIRENQTPDAAAVALQPFLELARRRKAFRRDYVEALDEMGTCLQKQEKYDEAEPYYREALNLARKDLKKAIPSSLLNNYTDLLRKTERSLEAIPLYEQAIAIDRSLNNLNKSTLDGKCYVYVGQE